MRPKIKIAIDIDDTILEFCKGFASFCKEYHGLDLTPEELGIDFDGSFNSIEEAKSILKDFVDRGKCHQLEFCDGFQHHFSPLNREYELVIMTYRNYDLRDKTKEMFQNNLDRFNSAIYYTPDYEPRTKSSLCKKLNIGVIIEDAIEHAIDCAKAGIIVLLIDKVWNQNCEEHENIIRVNSWDDIPSALDNLRKSGCLSESM